MAQIPAAINICRKRGDTFPSRFTIKDSAGVVVDITGFTFLLTVDPAPDPSDALNNLFQLTGVITDATNGKLKFTPSVAQSNQTPATYYYDVEMTDTANEITTVASGQWQVVQDTTK